MEENIKSIYLYIYIYIYKTESFFYISETNNSVNQLYFNKK